MRRLFLAPFLLVLLAGCSNPEPRETPLEKAMRKGETTFFSTWDIDNEVNWHFVDLSYNAALNKASCSIWSKTPLEGSFRLQANGDIVFLDEISYGLDDRVPFTILQKKVGTYSNYVLPISIWGQGETLKTQRVSQISYPIYSFATSRLKKTLEAYKKCESTISNFN